MASGSFSQQFSDAVHSSLVSQMVDKAEKTVDRAQQLAPHDTGYMASTIGYTLNKLEYRAEFYVLAEYALFQEYGTRNTPPHPYLRPAINEFWSDTYGFETGLNFRNVFKTDKKLLVYGGKYVMHGLTKRQQSHVRKVLQPSHKALFKGAVARSKLHVRHAFP